MEIPVADDAPALAHRPMVGEPGHGLLQTAEAPARDPALEAGEVAVEGHELAADRRLAGRELVAFDGDRKSTRLNSSHVAISYAVFCLKKKRKPSDDERVDTTSYVA